MLLTWYVLYVLPCSHWIITPSIDQSDPAKILYGTVNGGVSTHVSWFLWLSYLFHFISILSLMLQDTLVACVCVCVECLPCFRVCIGLCSRLKAPHDCKSSCSKTRLNLINSKPNYSLQVASSTGDMSQHCLDGWMNVSSTSAWEVHDGISGRLFPPKGALLRSET